MSLFSLFVASFLPVMKVGMLCSIGAWAARQKLLTLEGRRVISSLIFNVFVPCLFLDKLGIGNGFGDAVKFWPLTLNIIVTHVIGGILGWLMVQIVKPPADIKDHMITATVIGNTGNLPIVLIGTLGADPQLAALGGADMGIQYIILGQLSCALIQMPFTNMMLRKSVPKDTDATPEETTTITTTAAPNDVEQNDKDHETKRLLDRNSKDDSAVVTMKRRSVSQFELASPASVIGTTVDIRTSSAVYATALPSSMSETSMPARSGSGAVVVDWSTPGTGNSMPPTRSVTASSDSSLQSSPVRAAASVVVLDPPTSPTCLKDSVVLVDSPEPFRSGTGFNDRNNADAMVISTQPRSDDTDSQPLLRSPHVQGHSDSNGSNGKSVDCGALQTQYRDEFKDVVWQRMKTAWKAAEPFLSGFFNPPVIATLVALAIATIKPIQTALYTPEGSFRLVGDVIQMQSNMAIPSLMLVLGANLSRGPGVANIPIRCVLSTILCRLIVLPVVGTALVMALRATGAMDNMLPIGVVGMLITHAVPTAIMVHSIATMYRNREDDIAALLFWEYLASAITIPLLLAFFLKLVV